MCTGDGGQAAAEREQRRQEELARSRQNELNRIAAERQAITASQQARRDELLATASAQEAAAKAESEQALAEFEGERAVLKQQAEAKTRAGQAAGQSLRVLAMNQGRQQGRSATISKRRNPRRGARQTTASLRLGSTASRGGSGSNLSI